MPLASLSPSQICIMAAGRSATLAVIAAVLLARAASEKFCRSRGRYLAPEDFALETCALCYTYMPASEFRSSTAAVNGSEKAVDNETTASEETTAPIPTTSKFVRAALMPARPDAGGETPVTWLASSAAFSDPHSRPIMVS